MIQIRAEGPRDRQAVRRLNAAAFGGMLEADLVDALRMNGNLFLSLVAEDDGAIVGHLAMSRVRSENGVASATGVRLAPMAVLP